jgi:hypothetical protein
MDSTARRAVNDAEVQGLAVIRGTGLELVVTLGTGVGTALFRDGELLPHLALAHHPGPWRTASEASSTGTPAMTRFTSETGIEVPAVTADEMREVDRIAIEETGPNLSQMMENAGRALAGLAIEKLGGVWPAHT